LEIKDMTSARGRTGIVEMLSGAPLETTQSEVAHAAATRTDVKTIIRHHVTNLRFDRVAPERIEASAYFAVLTEAGLDHWGRYRDVLVPVDDRWLFAHRFVAVDAMAEDSRMQRTGGAP
ncbi:MAG TPA: hypothetical protein VIR30_04925, partial [Nocardioides sp.]